MASSAETYLERIWKILKAKEGDGSDAAGLTLNANSGVISSGTSALVATPNRRVFAIQNHGVNPLFVKLGEGASTISFNFILKAGDAQDDGTGGFLSDETWKGAVTVAGTSPRYTITEIS